MSRPSHRELRRRSLVAAGTLGCALLLALALQHGPGHAPAELRSADEGRALYWVGSSSGGGGYYADLVENPDERPEEYAEKQRQAAEQAAASDAEPPSASPAARARRTGLRQIFHIPDLEQETDGLDLMQDFAPDAPSLAAEAPAPAVVPSTRADNGDDESYAMHSLRNAFEAKSLVNVQSLDQRPLGSLAWKSTPWKETWDLENSKDLGRHVGVANGATEIAPAADSPFDSVGAPDSYWPLVDGQKPTLNVRAATFRRLGSRLAGVRPPSGAVDGSKLMVRQVPSCRDTQPYIS